MNLKCHLISIIYNQAARDPPDTSDSRKVCFMHTNNNMQSSTQCRNILFRFLESFLKIYGVLLRTVFCISCKFGSPEIDMR